MAKQFDVVVIGGGPAGYVAAIRAGQLGLSVACAESNPYADPKGEPRLGGTCLNVGCIPSKALLQSSENYHLLHEGFAQHGITVSDAKIDIGTMVGRKNKIVDQFTGGIKGLFRKYKVTFIPGHGKFVAAGGAGWKLDIGGEAVEAKHVIVATGSRSRPLPGVPVDNETIVDNVGALDFKAVPTKLGIIGSGVIGLELGSVWKRLGAEVTILEALPTFLGACDEAVSKEAWKVFTAKQGLDIKLGCKIGEVKKGKAGVSIAYEQDGKATTLECDRLIVSIGRVPNTDGLAADAVGLKLDARGFIEVDGHCRSTLPNVYAVGDVVRGPMLAHKAMEEGVMVAEIIAGQAGHVNLDTVPWVIYTSPEIAWVGKTEQQLKAEGVAYRTGQIPFMANGRAMGMGDTTGFVKMIADAKTDRILGVHIIAAHASELISEAVVAMEFSASSEDLARIVHAHPTLSEVIHEAALAVDKRSLHF
ncbi:MAG: dihydrolipoyl dehydrogenase [Rhodocyclaceae bacterium]|jgi:dihydrolipoamide dehydrogenase|nr:dihydrolipoyl dehydrogenase [Rhodocyclaceae bacterium]MCA3073864.1 dihydrolipoyl dehydrogenase [Rhodocyclaceae bacterium]MCA3089235.1 dihydrolipoyl dehydrogenase [Rhodocyclaceae bacterium]MCA3092796.1 dihydrolipoyl dehydrogenase [Rhodocyclaceae bacterium]MCA3097113.1 dihydrolipoyl dehydrogenase [Rhodocyclaceae bacterium]